MATQTLKNQSLQLNELVVSNSYESNASGYSAAQTNISPAGISIINSSGNFALYNQLGNLEVSAPVIASNSFTAKGANPQLFLTSTTSTAYSSTLELSQANDNTLVTSGSLNVSYNTNSPCYTGGIAGAIFLNGGAGYSVSTGAEFTIAITIPSYYGATTSFFPASGFSVLAITPISLTSGGSPSNFASIAISGYSYVSGNTFNVYGNNTYTGTITFGLSVIAYNPVLAS